MIEEIMKQIEEIPNAVIVDIDGTIADKGNRNSFDYSCVGEDTPQKNIIELVWLLAQDNMIIFVSGRKEICRKDTETWITKFVIDYGPYLLLFMREDKDDRKDSIVKKEIFEKNIKDKFNIKFVLDDRNQTVDMWRKELGLTCLQVDYGNF